MRLGSFHFFLPQAGGQGTRLMVIGPFERSEVVREVQCSFVSSGGGAAVGFGLFDVQPVANVEFAAGDQLVNSSFTVDGIPMLAWNPGGGGESRDMHTLPIWQQMDERKFFGVAFHWIVALEFALVSISVDRIRSPKDASAPTPVQTPVGPSFVLPPGGGGGMIPVGPKSPPITPPSRPSPAPVPDKLPGRSQRGQKRPPGVMANSDDRPMGFGRHCE